MKIMRPRYLPIDPEYFEIIEEQMKNDETRVIYFTFSDEPELGSPTAGLLKSRITGKKEISLFSKMEKK